MSRWGKPTKNKRKINPRYHIKDAAEEKAVPSLVEALGALNAYAKKTEQHSQQALLALTLNEQGSGRSASGQDQRFLPGLQDRITGETGGQVFRDDYGDVGFNVGGLRRDREESETSSTGLAPAGTNLARERYESGEISVGSGDTAWEDLSDDDRSNVLRLSQMRDTPDAPEPAPTSDPLIRGPDEEWTEEDQAAAERNNAALLARARRGEVEGLSNFVRPEDRPENQIQTFGDAGGQQTALPPDPNQPEPVMTDEQQALFDRYSMNPELRDTFDRLSTDPELRDLQGATVLAGIGGAIAFPEADRTVQQGLDESGYSQITGGTSDPSWGNTVNTAGSELVKRLGDQLPANTTWMPARVAQKLGPGVPYVLTGLEVVSTLREDDGSYNLENLMSTEVGQAMASLAASTAGATYLAGVCSAGGPYAAAGCGVLGAVIGDAGARALVGTVSDYADSANEFYNREQGFTGATGALAATGQVLAAPRQSMQRADDFYERDQGFEGPAAAGATAGRMLTSPLDSVKTAYQHYFNESRQEDKMKLLSEGQRSRFQVLAGIKNTKQGKVMTEALDPVLLGVVLAVMAGYEFQSRVVDPREPYANRQTARPITAGIKMAMAAWDKVKSMASSKSREGDDSLQSVVGDVEEAGQENVRRLSPQKRAAIERMFAGDEQMASLLEQLSSAPPEAYPQILQQIEQYIEAKISQGTEEGI